MRASLTGAAARRAIDALAALPTDHLVFSHGDLAGSNVLWESGRVIGVLDWDLACLEDPAEDIASLAGWHGWDIIDDLATPAEKSRAEIIRRTFPLQVVAFGILHDRPQAEIERSVRNATDRFSPPG